MVPASGAPRVGGDKARPAALPLLDSAGTQSTSDNTVSIQSADHPKHGKDSPTTPCDTPVCPAYSPLYSPRIDSGGSSPNSGSHACPDMTQGHANLAFLSECYDSDDSSSTNSSTSPRSSEYDNPLFTSNTGGSVSQYTPVSTALTPSISPTSTESYITRIYVTDTSKSRSVTTGPTESADPPSPPPEDVFPCTQPSTPSSGRITAMASACDPAFSHQSRAASSLPLGLGGTPPEAPPAHLLRGYGGAR